MSLTIDDNELGKALQPRLVNPDVWLRLHHAQLSSVHGMPNKLPGGWVWSRAAIATWIDSYGKSDPLPVRDLVNAQGAEILKLFEDAA